jgi:hypothetical protein
MPHFLSNQPTKIKQTGNTSQGHLPKRFVNSSGLNGIFQVRRVDFSSEWASVSYDLKEMGANSEM